LSLPAWDYWFSVSIRRNRKSYIIGSLLLIGVWAAFIGAMYFFRPSRTVFALLGILFLLPMLLVYYNLAAQRLRDFGITGWLALLWIPINMLQNGYAELSNALSFAFWIVLVFVPGTKGDNRYGEDPLEQDYDF
jgi:uncharacterized membrane protein YhaH (DUF805 family)